MTHRPPVPPANRPTKGPKTDSAPPHQSDALEAQGKKGVPDNLEDQGRQGNIHQNTHHQGYQQDR